MVRQDFPEIFSYMIDNSSSYSINTNGTLITPSIAALMKNKGAKMIALYGSTEEIHDRVTNSPGSFDAVLQGMAYLKEAGAKFVIQLVPMKANYFQVPDMIRLAESISPYWRIGASWLFLSASGDKTRNNIIRAQRLTPKQALNLDTNHESCSDIDLSTTSNKLTLFEPCIRNRREFHIDPYGNMTFCSFIKDPSLLYSLRNGRFQECWEVFIPSLLGKIKATNGHLGACFSCGIRHNCHWCPAYAYLEHRDYASKISYLCALTKEYTAEKKDPEQEHTEEFCIVGIRVKVYSDHPIKNAPLPRIINEARRELPSVHIWHHYSMKYLDLLGLGKPIYKKKYWSVYKKGRSWIYLGSKNTKGLPEIAAIFNYEHTKANIYHNDNIIKDHRITNTLMMPSLDRSLLSWIIAFQSGCILKSSSFIIDTKGISVLGLPWKCINRAKSVLPDANILGKHISIIQSLSDQIVMRQTVYKTNNLARLAYSYPLSRIYIYIMSSSSAVLALRDKRYYKRLLRNLLIKPIIANFDWWQKVDVVLDKITEDIPGFIVAYAKNAPIDPLDLIDSSK